MAKKLKNGQAYYNIIHLLQETAEGQALKAKARRRLESARVAAATWSPKYQTNPVVMESVLELQFGHGDEVLSRNAHTGYNSNKHWFNMSSSCYVTPEELEQVVHNNFGKKVGNKYIVPTYNCKASRVIEMWKEMGYPFDNPLTRDLDRVTDEFHILILRTGEEALGKIEQYVASPEYAISHQEALDRYTIDEVKSCLLRFKGVRPEVLKLALDEYVMHEIMEV